MNEAHKVARLSGHHLSATRMFWLATAGAAQALDLADTVGTLAPRTEADFVVLDPQATPLLARRTKRADSLEELLFAFALLGDDRAVYRTYAASSSTSAARHAARRNDLPGFAPARAASTAARAGPPPVRRSAPTPGTTPANRFPRATHRARIRRSLGSSRSARCPALPARIVRRPSTDLAVRPWRTQPGLARPMVLTRRIRARGGSSLARTTSARGTPYVSQAFLISTGAVALAEIGDKTQLLSLVLAARYRKPVPIILGVLVATLVNHGFAGALGEWLGVLVTPSIMRWALAFSFIAMGLWILVPDKLDADEANANRSRLGVFGATLVAFFLAEMGDKTQIATVALAARFQDYIGVVAGDVRDDARERARDPARRPLRAPPADEARARDRGRAVRRARRAGAAGYRGLTEGQGRRAGRPRRNPALFRDGGTRRGRGRHAFVGGRRRRPRLSTGSRTERTAPLDSGSRRAHCARGTASRTAACRCRRSCARTRCTSLPVARSVMRIPSV